MKKRVCFMGVLLLALTGFVSCSDSDHSPDKSSILQMYGANYQLTEAVLWEYNPISVIPSIPYVFKDTYVKQNGETVTDNIQGYTIGNEQKVLGNFTLSLYEDGLVFNPAIEAVYGKAACICFHLSSSDPNRLVAGKYTYNENREASTFYAYVSSDYDTDADVVPAKITEGEINISNEGEKYKLNFKAKTSFGGEINGTYEGIIHPCKVKQSKSAYFESIHLEGLLDTVVVKIDDPNTGIRTETGLDITNGAAFLSTSTGICTYAKNKANADVALVWNTHQQTFKFESPIRMRSYLGHDDTYNFSCHTLYMKAPDTFTDSDFENLENTGFEFTVKEEEIVLPTTNWQPCYIFFQTGNGIKGVMKLKDYIPLSEREEDSWGTISTYPVNPVIVMEMKMEGIYNNLRIR